MFSYDRMVDGLRESALGTLWNPAYFNYGIAIHGALNVPLQPASHGCVRIPMAAGEVYQDHIAIGDQVLVWDGIKEPEEYDQRPGSAYPRGELSIFNRVDPTFTTTTTAARRRGNAGERRADTGAGTDRRGLISARLRLVT